MKHIPVLLTEIIEIFEIKPDGIYLDLTLGRGGHSSNILKKLTTGKLISFDKDISAIKESEPILSKINNNFNLIHSDFKNLEIELKKLKIEKVDGILIDLGVSSPQLDNAERGFSYNKDAILDMRMNQNQQLTAYDVVNNYSEEQLIEIFKKYADVMLPKRVAKGILENRPIKTTLELVEIIKKSLPSKIVREKNPAKAVFQAIRIEVNNELDSLEQVLSQAIKFLNLNGKLAIISFHSIEDRIVKNFFGNLIKNKVDYRLPILEEKKWQVKTINPKKEEIEFNRRSRSAKLRVLTKLK